MNLPHKYLLLNCGIVSGLPLSCLFSIKLLLNIQERGYQMPFADLGELAEASAEESPHFNNFNEKHFSANEI